MNRLFGSKCVHFVRVGRCAFIGRSTDLCLFWRVKRLPVPHPAVAAAVRSAALYGLCGESEPRVCPLDFISRVFY